MVKTKVPRILTPTDSYVYYYPQAVQAAIEQQKIFWAAEKMGVEKDEEDFRTNLTSGEAFAVLTLQAILTQYELIIGGKELWTGHIRDMFPRPDIERMCIAFGNAELNSHAPFYKLGNQVLHKDDDAFYSSWKDDEVLSSHISYIDKCSSSTDPALVTAATCFLEGCILFTAFAFFKSFNNNGFSLIKHFVSGIDASAKDENFHSMGSAFLYNTYMKELNECDPTNFKSISEDTEKAIYVIAKESYKHEAAIIDLIFSKDPETIRTINKEDLLDFVKHRVDVVLSYLNLAPLFKVESQIAKNFYNSVSTYKYADFFVADRVQYVSDWNLSSLIFKSEIANEYL